MTTATRVLRLLSLLQARREWCGADLSERLEVDARTIRRDVNRLRDLGYVIESCTGPGGGYRLGAGSNTPPLLLDDQEALTVAMAIGTMSGAATQFTDAALRVLVKLDQLLPSRLRRRWKSLKDVMLSLSNGQHVVDPTLLADLAANCRDQRCIDFKYADRKGERTARHVEPVRLVHTGRVWYLVAWDIDRGDWRTFRVDRIDGSSGVRAGARFAPRESPSGGFEEYVSRAITASAYRYRARIRIEVSISDAKRRIPSWIGVFEACGEGQTVITLGAESLEALAALIVHVGTDFELLEPAELASYVRAVSERLARGVSQLN
ncbi:MAG: YafY family protein [Polyangiaceae bacterium]